MDQDSLNSIQFPKPVRPTLSSSDLMKSIRKEPIPRGSVGIWHLGQNGFIIREKDGPIITIDPYLTDYCASGWTGEKTGKSRFLPVIVQPEDLETDILLLTHSHCDHADPYTLSRITSKDKIQVIAPWAASKVARENGFPPSSIKICHPGEIIETAGLVITVTFALPTDATDLCHTGFHIRFTGGRTFYNTGDTAVSSLVAPSVPEGIDLMTVCINGGYNNLSFHQAAELVKSIGPRYAAPTHYDTMPHNFQPPGLFLSAVARISPEIRPIIIPYYKPFIF
jgi:L-ascorbate 6-phosphate lactonase